MNRVEEYRHCPLCGGKLEEREIKPGEPRRLVCVRCDYVFYIDPKLAACVIIRVDEKIVLLKRGIPPEYGKWVLPGGFVDVGETVPTAAAREAWEEVRLEVSVGPLVGVYSYPETDVVVIVYEAAVRQGVMQAADETLEVKLFSPLEIPWRDLAFTSTRDALTDYLGKHFPHISPKLAMGIQKR